MEKIERVTIRQSNTSYVLEAFEKINGKANRSKTILAILKYFTMYDPNWVRNLLSMQPLSEQEVEEIKALACKTPLVEAETVSSTALVPVETTESSQVCI